MRGPDRIPAALAHTRWGRALRGALRRLRRRAKPSPLDEAELLARTEEFNRNAEAYWRSLAADAGSRVRLLDKPLSTVRDTAQILYRLGLTLDALDLGVGHTVLDFGAGSCWLSSMLNRLRCRTIAVDVSPTALALGQELFATDKRHLLELSPRFLPYDGRRLPLPDASVDRIVCFDAFHHVPNQDEVLVELHRVLKPGGRAVLTEPGEGHSHAGQSLFESERYGVLENELGLPELAAKMRSAGFDRVLLRAHPEPDACTLTAEEYRRLIDGATQLFPLALVREQLRRNYLFILTKGEQRRDSRNPGRLLAEIRPLDGTALRGRARSTAPLRVAIRNAGDTLWLHDAGAAGGTVALGGRLEDDGGACVQEEALRAGLPKDVAPGEEVSLHAEVTLPAALGRYRLRLDLVDEYVCWFALYDSTPVDLEVLVDEVPDSRAPNLLKAAIELAAGAPSDPRQPGETIRLPVRLTNLGDTVWLDGPAGAAGRVGVGGHLLDESGATSVSDYFRTPLPRSVAPGESIEVECSFLAPLRAGRHRLLLDLVAEERCWFAAKGSRTVEVPLESLAGTPDSRAPGLLRARLEPEIAELRALVGATVALAVRITNLGNTRWLHAPRPEDGHVALAGHLLGTDGARLEWDLFRASLPRDLEPGETTLVSGAFPAPLRPGRYLVELDLVDEGVAWFGAQGSATVTVSLTVD